MNKYTEEFLESIKLDEARRSKKPTKFIGTNDRMSYAVSLNDFDATRIKGGSFGVLIDLNTILKKWKIGAKSYHVGAKGKPTLAAVRAWIKSEKPNEFYARWESDSSTYKDDSVEIFYK